MSLAPRVGVRQGDAVHATAGDLTTQRPPRGGWLLVILVPLGLIGLLRGAPAIDDRWENTPVHFWLVLATAAVCVVLAFAITESARRRRDGRLLLIGLAFAVSAGFLGLHALATPGMILAGKNAGFVLATPIGLVLAGAFAAASAVEYGLAASLRIVQRARLLEALVVCVLAAWAVVSVADLPPLRHPVTPSEVGRASCRERVYDDV